MPAGGRTVSGKETVVDVAQLVELRVVIPAVEGSSPFVHPIYRLVSSLVRLTFLDQVFFQVSVGFGRSFHGYTGIIHMNDQF